jgi:endonuclease/exonuclease/phosphatase family metal-dependent hydrolase
MSLLPLDAGSGNCRAIESVELRDFLNPPIWVLPEDPRHRVKLDLACNSAGPVTITSPDFHGSPAPARALPNPSLDNVVVISWNTYLGRGNLPDLVARLGRGEFTAGRPVESFVLLLQEVYRSQILKFARDRKLHAVYAPTRKRDGDDEDRGAAIVSTLRPDNVLVVELPFEKTRRIALGAGFEGGEPAWHIRLVNTHFDTNVGLLRGGPSAARRRQARALQQVLTAWPAPLSVAGDLNTWWGDDEPAVKELRRAFPDAEPLRARETWRGPLWTGNKLDYVFAKGTVRPVPVRRLDSRFGSDHWPLIAVVPLR